MMDTSQTDSPAVRKNIRTVKCILCGGNQIYPGPRFENHLINEHGIIFDIDYIINLSAFKEEHQDLPNLDNFKKTNGDAAGHFKAENGSKSDCDDKTDVQSLLCIKCQSPIDDKGDLPDGGYEAFRNKFIFSSNRKSRSGKWQCTICKQNFSRGYKLRLHMMSNHKNMTSSEMAKAKDIFPSKLIFKCGVCSSKPVRNFNQHIKKCHNSTKEEYIKNHGLPEKYLRQFCCKFCDRQLRPTRLNVSNHMKLVHKISLGKYRREMAATVKGKKEKRAKNAKVFPPKMVDCIICNSAVKDMKEHLSKMHQMNEALYDQLVARRNKVDSNSGNKKVFKCRICDKDCFDLKKHLEGTHKLSEELYDDVIAIRSTEVKSLLKPQFRKEGATVSAVTPVGVQVKPTTPQPATVRLVTLTPISPPKFVASPSQRKLEVASVSVEPKRAELKLCRICKTGVRNFKEHLKNVHKISEQEYESQIFKEKTPEKKAPEVRPAIKEPVAEPVSELVYDKNLPKPPKEDIQDKHNKRCSSCIITFDSRRSFIEHCTIMHAMKFKTKSGQTISAPFVQDRLRKEALKRQAEVDSQPPKRIKMSEGFTIEIDNGEHDEGYNVNNDDAISTASSMQRKTMFTPAGVSKWNQCKYECCFCKWTTMSRSSMTSHLHNTHGIPIQEYKKSNYPDIEVETNWFQCRLCSARTKFVKDCIAPHLKMSHGMDIDTYEREIMLPEDWPYEVVPEPSLRSEIRVPNAKSANVSPISISKPPPLQARPKSTLLQPRTTPTIVIDESVLKTAGTITEDRDKWNRCRYQCAICELITIDARQMRMHIANHHNITYDEYVKIHGPSEFVSKKFQCRICGSEMKFCRQNIYAHMKDVHKTSLIDYELKYGVPPDDDLGDIAADEPSNDDIADPDQHQQEVWRQPNGQSGLMDRGLLDDGRKPSRWNKCRFQCAICNKLSSEKRHIREHIIKIHNLTLNDYESQYGECEIHTEYFFCGVCHAEVKHNLKNIALHLNNVHNINPKQYEEQFGRISDEDVTIPESSNSVTDNSSGIGSHFLMSDAGSNNAETSPAGQVRKIATPLRNPPKCDIVNPKNKFCLPCNKDFNRRQAFVEHCRIVHKLKLKFKRPLSTSSQASPVASIPTSSPATSTPTTSASTPPTNFGGYACEYCGKVFSNRSNRTRHVVLSCEVAKIQKSSSQQASQSRRDSYSDGDDYPPRAPREPIHCPFPECDVIHLRTALMKRHLCEAHNIQNVADLTTESSVNESAEISTQESNEGEEPNGDEGAEKRVPPIRVKLHSDLNSPEQSPRATVVTTPSATTTPTTTAATAAATNKTGTGKANQHLTCKFCGTHKSKNLYLLSRHKKACLKRTRELKRKSAQAAATAAAEEAAAAQEAAADETAGDEADAVDEAAVEADEEGLEETANGEANENHEDGEEEDVEMETQAEAD